MLAGGNANNGAKAGVFYFNANNDSGNDNPNNGARLCLLYYLEGVETLALAKIQSNTPMVW